MAETWQLQWQVTNKDLKPIDTNTVTPPNQVGQLPVQQEKPKEAPPQVATAPQAAAPTPQAIWVPTVVQQPKQEAPKQKTTLPLFVERQAEIKINKYITDQSLFDAFLNKEIWQNEITYLKETDPNRYKALQNYAQGNEAKWKITAYRSNLEKSTQQPEVVDVAPVDP